MTPTATVITFSSAIDGSHWTLALELQRCMPFGFRMRSLGVWVGLFFWLNTSRFQYLDHGSSRVNIWRLLR